ncbi:MAG: glutathione S-transferase family protein [Pseudomonadota bacterium]
MKVYGDLRSGNCYKIRLICSLLDIQHEWVHVDILAGETATPDFLNRNPVGKIPVLELENGLTLSESNAIVNYLAAGSRYLPEERFALAKVQQWQFFEQYSIEPYIAVARFIARYLNMPENRREEYEAKQPGGRKALAVVDEQLKDTEFLLGAQLTAADVCVYGYTHVADEGGFNLTDYPAVQRWIGAIQSQPGYVGMT